MLTLSRTNFPGLGKELLTSLQWRVRRAQIVFVSSASNQQAGTVASIITSHDFPVLDSQSRISSSAGIIKPVSSSWKSNTLGAQVDWRNSDAAGALLHFAHAGVVGATATTPVILGILEVDVTFEFRGSTV